MDDAPRPTDSMRVPSPTLVKKTTWTDGVYEHSVSLSASKIQQLRWQSFSELVQYRNMALVLFITIKACEHLQAASLSTVWLYADIAKKKKICMVLELYLNNVEIT